MSSASPFKRASGAGAAAVIVAHPDDETLWAGGTIAANPDWNWFILTLCRAGDPDRAPRFRQALERLRATGGMADLDDGPEQSPLSIDEIQRAVLSLLPATHFDLVLTHAPNGEYTRHRRHEELSLAVIDLWRSDRISTGSILMFAYEDAGGRHLPRPRPDAHLREKLAEPVWQRKCRIITEIYGFSPDSWEGRTTPREEAFWYFGSAASLEKWLSEKGMGL